MCTLMTYVYHVLDESTAQVYGLQEMMKVLAL